MDKNFGQYKNSIYSGPWFRQWAPIWVSFLQSPGWGREVLELHDPWDGVGPSLASQIAMCCLVKICLCRIPQVCPAGRLG